MRDALTRITSIALDAGRAILAQYAHPDRPELKPDESPVTAADRAAHAVIVTALATTWPAMPIVSEEGTIPPYDVRRAWRSFWLVDPLDGTKEYLARNGEFTVNIALIEDGIPVLGVVHAPVIGVTYSAASGEGAWRRAHDEAPERIASRPVRAGAPVVVVESRSHPSPTLETWIRTVNVARRVQAGSSLKLCWVADGQAHVYPRFGPTMEWDVAAGDCIYRNARAPGGAPSPLTYNKPDLRNGDFVLGM